METTTVNSLSPRHIEDLRKSGLTDETIGKYDFGSISRDEATSILGFKAPSGGWCIGYPNSTFFKFKPDNPYDPKVKYLSAKGTAQCLFVTNLAAKVLDDISQPYYFTEGEKKCMALEQAGYPAIGVSGVWNWISNGHVNEKLPQINLAGRIAYIVYDSDKYDNKNVLLAETRFGAALVSLGAKVKIVDLRPEFGKGADDQLLCLKEGFQKYIDEARDYDPKQIQLNTKKDPKTPSDLLSDDEMVAFVKRIAAIPADTSPIKIPSMLAPILKDIAGLNITQSDALLRHVIKVHFRLKDADLKSYDKELAQYRKAINRGGTPTAINREELIKKLQEEKGVLVVHPVQDYADGRMVFSVKIGDMPYVITSDREIFSFDDARQEGLILKHDSVDMTRFSNDGIAEYLNGRYEVKISVLYKKIYDYVKQFILFPADGYLKYLVLWVMATYVFMLFRYFPYVWVNAEKRSGKSLLMEVLSAIAFNGDVMTKPTEAVLYRDVEYNLTSMFIDEFEKVGEHDKQLYAVLKGILNAGFCKTGIVKRCEKGQDGKYITQSYSAYSPKMFAGISDIDDVLQDRTVRIKLLRKKDAEDITRYKQSKEILDLQQGIRDDLYVFALTYAKQLSDLYQDDAGKGITGLDHLNNRELDIWEPIILLANMIDSEDPTIKLTEKMAGFSELSLEQKHADSLEENETYKLLTVFQSMLEDGIEPLQSNGDSQTFNADKVFRYFQGSEHFSWILKRNALTTKLKKIEVLSGQVTVAGDKVPVYRVNLTQFKNFWERYAKGTVQ